jgi:hypothetical protein
VGKAKERDPDKHRNANLAAQAKRRRAHDNEGARYLNVAGGTRAEMDLELEAWTEMGVLAAVNPGPIICATANGGRTMTHMPLEPATLAGSMKRHFQSAYLRMMDGEGGGEEQLAGLAMNLHGPKWNSHSCRRGGTKLARSLADSSGATKESIDGHFRWGAKDHNRQQQVAYASLEEAEVRMAVTLYF